jgi:tRNA-Thr(GGU) m(6)t(6)A37 methyltransferase TsaA
MKIEYQPIGTIHSPFAERKGMPIQPAGAQGVKGTIEILPEFRAGLQDLDGFSHVILLYHFHCSEGYELTVTPFMDPQPHGVFATRAPKRPNAIGLSVVHILGIEDGIIQVENIDILDGTPLLDIKPYVPQLDCVSDLRTGWLATRAQRATSQKSDDRFL